MAEPRARLRSKGQVFSTTDLSDLLYSLGDNTSARTTTTTPPPHSRQPQSSSLPTTISTLDEILTDFIIETCHAAALSASYSRRQKIKVDDFKWVLRKDEVLLGRVLEQLWKDRKMKDARKFNFEEMEGGGVAALAEVAEQGGASKEMVKKGRRGKRKAGREDEGERSAKRVAS